MTDYQDNYGNRIFVKEGHMKYYIIAQEIGQSTHRFPPLNMHIFSTKDAAVETLNQYAKTHALKEWDEPKPKPSHKTGGDT